MAVTNHDSLATPRTDQPHRAANQLGRAGLAEQQHAVTYHASPRRPRHASPCRERLDYTALGIERLSRAGLTLSLHHVKQRSCVAEPEHAGLSHALLCQLR